MTKKKRRFKMARAIRRAAREHGDKLSLPESLRLVREYEKSGNVPEPFDYREFECPCGLRGCMERETLYKGRVVFVPWGLL